MAHFDPNPNAINPIAWTQHSLAFTATSTGTVTIRFRAYGTPSGFNNVAAFFLDNITLKETICPCVTPTADAVNSTCSAGVAQNNGTITISNFTAGQRYQYSAGATFNSGAAIPATITAIPAGGVIASALPNTTQQYTVRIYSPADDACFVDRTVQITEVICPVCVFTTTSYTPECHANGTPEDGSDDYITFTLNVANSLQGSLNYTVTAEQNGNPIVITLANGQPATAVNCNLNTPLRTPAGTAGGGLIVLTITDNQNGCNTTENIVDPGSCAVACVPGTPSMVMYSYATQAQVTDLNMEPIIIPKFDNLGGTRVLTSVKLDYEVGLTTTLMMENSAANPQTFEFEMNGTAPIKLGASTIATPGLQILGPEINFPAGISVPAQGTWPGDATNSTLQAMQPWLEDEKMALFKNPTTDPRWVTNATGNPTTDDDIAYFPPTTDVETGSITYTMPGDLSNFIGVGNLPLSVSTTTNLTSGGGGGNIDVIQRTRAYASAKVTYIYTCCNLGILSATPSICDPATNTYSLNVVVTYSGGPGGNITVNTTNGGTVTVAATSSPQTITLTGLVSNGVTNIGVSAFFVNDPTCAGSLPNAYDAPAKCDFVAVGNYVFMDNNDSGTFNVGDMPIPLVTVQLYPAGANYGVDAPLATTVTDPSGYYYFDNLNAGNYVVFIPAANFAPGGALQNKESVPGAQTGNTDNDDNGQDAKVNGGIRSNVFTLTPNAMPTNESGGGGSGTGTPAYTGLLDDDNLNETIDFGFRCVNPLPDIVADITVNTDPGVCTAVVTYNVNIVTTPSGNLTVTYVFTGATTGSGSGTGSGSTFNLGETTITITATNACTTVVDNGKPVFTSVPANVTINCTEAIPAVGAATASDGCGGNVTVVYVGAWNMAASGPGNYQIMRTWRATDACGNSTTAAQIITIQDNTPPTFVSFPNNVTIQCSQSVPALTNPTASDGCGGYVQITYLGQVRNNGSCLYNYTLTRTWRATDLCGNSTTRAQVITVQDTQLPNFTGNLPANVTVTCAPNCVPLPPVLTATDNCGPATVTLQENQTTGDCTTGYTVTRTWTATDVCGNARQHTQVYTVLAAPLNAPTEDRDQTADEPINTSLSSPQGATLKTVTLLPNPTTDWVSIGLGDFAGEAVVVSIHDELGRLIWEQRIPAVEESVLRVNLRQTGASAGLYAVSVRSGGQVYSKRLVLVE